MRTQKKYEDEKLPMSLKIKKYRILIGYYSKRLANRFNFAYLLFALSLSLFLFITIPNLLHRVPLLNESWENWPMRLELYGTVMAKANNTSQDSNLILARLAKIQIGGYFTTADYDGKFDLTFTSQTYSDIPVIIHWSNKTFIQRISFQLSQFKREVVLLLE